MSKTVKTAPVKPATKDSGRVQLGAGMMRFATKATRDTGKVVVGAGMMRF